MLEQNEFLLLNISGCCTLLLVLPVFSRHQPIELCCQRTERELSLMVIIYGLLSLSHQWYIDIDILRRSMCFHQACILHTPSTS